MLTEKEKYILEQIDLENGVEEKISLDNDLLEFARNKAKEKQISLEEYINLILIEMIFKKQKESYIGDFDNIIDMYDFYKLDSIINEQKEFLILTYDKPLVLIPYN